MSDNRMVVERLRSIVVSILILTMISGCTDRENKSDSGRIGDGQSEPVPTKVIAPEAGEGGAEADSTTDQTLASAPPRSVEKRTEKEDESATGVDNGQGHEIRVGSDPDPENDFQVGIDPDPDNDPQVGIDPDPFNDPPIGKRPDPDNDLPLGNWSGEGTGAGLQPPGG